jgi:hypothetical protein
MQAFIGDEKVYRGFKGSRQKNQAPSSFDNFSEVYEFCDADNPLRSSS